MNTLFRKYSYQVVRMGCWGFFFFLFFIPILILAGVPVNLGLKNQLFSACPKTPNCVSSHEKNSLQHVQPIIFAGSLQHAKERLYQVINSMSSTRIITQENVYWHVEFTTQLLRFIDDVEFYFDESLSVIHIRSASREGYWDLGVNRRRVETIRSRFEELTKKTN